MLQEIVYFLAHKISEHRQDDGKLEPGSNKKKKEFMSQLSD